MALAALRLVAHYAKYRLRRLHPFEVQAALLNACNLKCVYCRCPEIKTALLTTAQWCAIVEGLAALGTLRIKFQGGEPTIRRDFNVIAATARQAGIITAVITNGIRIAADPRLLDHLDEVVVSLDAVSPALHDRHRGAGSHSAALHTAQLAGERQRHVVINMVVTRATLPELEAMVALCEAHGWWLNAQAVMFGKEYQDSGASALRLDEDDERRMYRQLAEWKRHRRPVIFSSRAYERTAAWPDYAVLAIRGPHPSSCPMGRDYVHIEPNGDVHPCSLHAASYAPLNIVRDGLETALAHARVHDCADCALAYLNERKELFALRPAAVIDLLRRA